MKKVFLKQSAPTLGFLAGVSLLILAFLFIRTGYDEIWNGQRLWMYGLVWLAILIVNGASLLGFSLGRVKCSLRSFVVLNAVLFGMLILALALDL
ncbi:MAG: hypothetical protein WC866_06360 [Patescibacteria group bacterium]|jgi:hypothetical protein